MSRTPRSSWLRRVSASPMHHKVALPCGAWQCQIGDRVAASESGSDSDEPATNPPDAESAQGDRCGEEDPQLGPLDCPVVANWLVRQQLAYPEVIGALLKTRGVSVCRFVPMTDVSRCAGLPHRSGRCEAVSTQRPLVLAQEESPEESDPQSVRQRPRRCTPEFRRETQTGNGSSPVLEHLIQRGTRCGRTRPASWAAFATSKRAVL